MFGLFGDGDITSCKQFKTSHHGTHSAYERGPRRRAPAHYRYPELYVQKYPERSKHFWKFYIGRISEWLGGVGSVLWRATCSWIHPHDGQTAKARHSRHGHTDSNLRETYQSPCLGLLYRHRPPTLHPLWTNVFHRYKISAGRRKLMCVATNPPWTDNHSVRLEHLYGRIQKYDGTNHFFFLAWTVCHKWDDREPVLSATSNWRHHTHNCPLLCVVCGALTDA